LAATPFSVSSKLDSHLWNLYARGFYDVNIGNVNVETVLGYHTAIRQGNSVAKPPDEYHANARVGYDFKNVAATGWRVTPYLAADDQRNWGNTSKVLNLGLGVAVSHKNGVTWFAWMVQVGHRQEHAGNQRCAGPDLGTTLVTASRGLAPQLCWLARRCMGPATITVRTAARLAVGCGARPAYL